MRQLKVEILRISSVLMDFFYRRSQDSTYTRTPHALRNNDSRLNLTIPQEAVSVKSVYVNPQKVCDFSGNPYSTGEIHRWWMKSLLR